MYAIFEDSGTQIKASAGDVIDIDRRQAAEGDKLTFDRVLLVGDASKGKPATVGLWKVRVAGSTSPASLPGCSAGGGTATAWGGGQTAPVSETSRSRTHSLGSDGSGSSFAAAP